MIAKSKFGEKDLASVAGQIILCLLDGPKPASEIYGFVKASQPTVSKRLADLLSKGVIILSHTPDDRRINMYSLNYAFFDNEVDRDAISSLIKLGSMLNRHNAMEP